MTWKLAKLEALYRASHSLFSICSLLPVHYSRCRLTTGHFQIPELTVVTLLKGQSRPSGLTVSVDIP